MNRKAIKFAETYVVSLPTEWGRRFSIDKNRDLEVTENEKGELVISTQKSTKLPEAVIKVKEGLACDRIFFKINKEYLIGKSVIRVTGIEHSEQFNVITLVKNKLIGLEVTEQTSDSITFSDMLKVEEINISKLLSSIFSFLESMGNDIIIHIKEDRELGDLLLQRDSAVDRTHNLIYRCCNLAMKDSKYLKFTGKSTNQIVAISRIIKNLEFLGNILVGISYIVNTKMSKGMEKYRFPVFEKDKEVNRIIRKYIEKWLAFFKDVRKAVIKGDPDFAADIYINRFDTKIDLPKDITYNKHMTFLLSLAEHLNRDTSAIARELLVL